MSDGVTWQWGVGATLLAALVLVPVARATWTLVTAAARAVVLAPVAVALPAMLALHAMVTVACTLFHDELLQERYFTQLWLPYACALAAGVGGIARRGRGWAALAVVLVLVHHGRDFAGVLAECRTVDLGAPYAELEGELVAHDATVGYAQYDEAYLASYLSDERVRLTSLGARRRVSDRGLTCGASGRDVRKDAIRTRQQDGIARTVPRPRRRGVGVPSLVVRPRATAPRVRPLPPRGAGGRGSAR